MKDVHPITILLGFAENVASLASGLITFFVKLVVAQVSKYLAWKNSL